MKYRWQILGSVVVVVFVVGLWSQLWRPGGSADSGDDGEFNLLEKEADEKCSEAERRMEIFNKKHPKVQDKRQNEKALKSPEWLDAMGWQQACDTAEADAEQALTERLSTRPSPR